MTELLTAAQMRAIEGAAIASGEVTGLELMERAGRGVVDAVFAERPDLAAGPHRAKVFCGPGNNGGDGFVVARLLKERGWDVEVFFFGTPDRLPPDARRNHDRWRATGGGVRPVDAFLDEGRWNTDLVVDALFGTGLTRPIAGLDMLLFSIADGAEGNAGPESDAARFDAPLAVAVDLPSGLDTDSGAVLVPVDGGQAAAAANLTVTFHAKKRAHAEGQGPRHCGKVVVADIGLGPWDGARETA